jgi:hypothetical protein
MKRTGDEMLVNQGDVYWLTPGNVLLEAAEANLPRQSVVVVSQVSTVEKSQLGEYIGTLNEQRVDQILAGLRFLQRMMERGETGEEKP